MDSAVESIECGGSGLSGTRLVAVILKREQLIYDIENNCYIEGHVLTEAHDEVRHSVQDVGQEGNVDRVTRILEIAHADIVERLYPFTQREVRHPVVDDRLRETPVFPVFLKVPQSFSQTTLSLLGKLIHELLVCTATADWMSITYPPKEELWKRKALEVIDRIGKIRMNRQGRRRITPHWL